jgi:hypothetical protein
MMIGIDRLHYMSAMCTVDYCLFLWGIYIYIYINILLLIAAKKSIRTLTARVFDVVFSSSKVSIKSWFESDAC